MLWPAGSLSANFPLTGLVEDQFLATYSGEANRGNWKCTIWPEIGGTQFGSDAGDAVWAVTSFAKYPEDAANLICYYALDKDCALDFWKTRGGTLPQHKELLNSGIFLEGQEKITSENILEGNTSAVCSGTWRNGDSDISGKME